MAQSKVIRTLLYSDIFDYPLTLPQIHKYLITSKKTPEKEILKLLKQDKSVKSKEGFYFLDGKVETVSLRKKREKESFKKIKRASKAAGILKFIPTIKLLGISGSVSMKNAEKEEDIDLFIICSKRTIWSTRLLTVCILILMGAYRKKNEVDPSNKFCLNMIIDEDSLLLPKIRQDIYSAHEITQTLPLFERKNTFEKFIKTNFWIKKYLANFEPNTIRNEKTNLISELIWKLFQILKFEKLAKFIQIKYMGLPTGHETIGDFLLAFHPKDPRKQIVKTYEMKLKTHNFITLGH